MIPVKRKGNLTGVSTSGFKWPTADPDAFISCVNLNDSLIKTVDLLKRRDAIIKARKMDLLDTDEADQMMARVEFEYAILRDISLLPEQQEETER